MVASAFASSTDAERWVVGSMLIDTECVPRAVAQLRASDFADVTCRATFKSIAARHRRGDPIDAGLILQDLRALPEVIEDPAAFLGGLSQDVPTSAHVSHYVGQVTEASHRRRIIEAAELAVENAKTGQPIEEVLADLESFAGDLRRDTPEQGSGRVSLGQLKRKHPRLRPTVVEGLFRAGESCNLVSHSKVGKSWLAYNLALSIVTGGKWFDRFETTPGRVLLIDNELHPETLASRVPKVAEAMGIDPTACDSQIDVWSLRGNLKPLSQLRREFEQIGEGEYVAIILDAKYRFIEPDASENDNAAEARLYNLVDQYAAITGAAIVLVHHSSKGTQTGKRVTDVGAGAGAQSRAADCHVVLREHEERDAFVLDAAVRSFKPVAPFVIRWKYPLWRLDASLDPQQMLGRAKTSEEKDDERETRRLDKNESDDVKVLAEMRTLKEPKAASDIAPLAGISNGRGTASLVRLEAAECVELVSVKAKNGREYERYQLTVKGRGEHPDSPGLNRTLRLSG